MYNNCVAGVQCFTSIQTSFASLHLAYFLFGYTSALSAINPVFNVMNFYVLFMLGLSNMTPTLGLHLCVVSE